MEKFRMQLDTLNIAVLGLGYVGLPLAVEFGSKYPTLGFDISSSRVKELTDGNDGTFEVSKEEFKKADKLGFTDDLYAIAKCNFFIVTVPTPIDNHNRPDLSPLINVTKSLAVILKKGDIVVYESTVFPGCTEEICVPILEKLSGLKFNEDFYVGYSPERINPGDKDHRLTNIVKITSGSNDATAIFIDVVYSSIIVAGTHMAETIRVAEAAKVIENTQRDVNIALVNELSLIFNKLNISTEAVLRAAGTKWNFLPFRPGLVGGHCIGVDPYYLTHKAQEVGYHPEIILAGRRLNDSMPLYVANNIVRLMNDKKIHIRGAKILILGLTFKENCPDTRNSKIIDLVQNLNDFGANIDVYDPWVEQSKAPEIIKSLIIDNPLKNSYDVVVCAVAHKQFIMMGFDGVKALCKSQSNIIYDVKNLFPSDAVDGRL
jgi:UDP-N-acetyl-D-glucosamine/UDP-N-acetyl-D-galactosamine dehydrogenase